MIITILLQLLSILILVIILYILNKSLNNNNLFFKLFLYSILYFLIVSCYYLSFLHKILINFSPALSSALPEELIKYLLLSLIFKVHHLYHKRTKVLSALIIAAIFATLENSLYLISVPSLLRLITSLPMHLVSSFYLAFYRLGFLIAFILHYLYNNLVLLNTGFSLLIFPLLMVSIIIALLLYLSLSDEKNKIDFLK